LGNRFFGIGLMGIIAANESATIRTRVFDRAQHFQWPERWPGRALRNDFAERWHGREEELENDPGAQAALARAKTARDFDTASIYAGQAVGTITAERSAAAIVHDLAEGGEAQLRAAQAFLA